MRLNLWLMIMDDGAGGRTKDEAPVMKIFFNILLKQRAVDQLDCAFKNSKLPIKVMTINSSSYIACVVAPGQDRGDVSVSRYQLRRGEELMKAPSFNTRNRN